MLKLLIVDDNDFERNALASFINWDVLGIQIADTAHNGQDAVEKAKLCKPDIIISDVKMPVMDGIEMARILKTQLPDTKFIFSSGHDDVALLKDALEVRAFNYIIKPVNPDELLDTVKKVVTLIMDEKLASLENESIIRQYKDNLLYLQSRFLSGILSKEMKPEEINEALQQAGRLKLGLVGGYRLVLIDMDYESEEISVICSRDNTVADELRSACKAEPVLFFEMEYDRVAALLHHLDASSPKVEKIIAAIMDKLNIIKEDLNFRYTLGVSSPASELAELHTLYKQSLAAVKRKIERGYNQVIQYGEGPDKRSVPVDDIKEKLEKKLEEIVDRAFDGEDCDKELEDLLSEISLLPGLLLDNAKGVFINLLNRVSMRMQQSGDSFKKIAGTELDIYTRIISAKIIPDIKQQANVVLEAVSAWRVGRKSGKEDHIVDEIVKILDSEYDKPITLTYLSEKVYLSSNYLRILFKNKMGVSIQDYLTDLRIRKAKEFLRKNQYKIHEIGEMVGYANSTYFNIVFKNKTRLTPGEYRSRYMAGESDRDRIEKKQLEKGT